MIGTNHFPLDGVWGEVASELGIDPEDQFHQIDTELAWMLGTPVAINRTYYTHAQMYASFFFETIRPAWERFVNSAEFFRLATAKS